MTDEGRSSGFPKAIILDLDDTILDSGDPEVSWRRVSSEFAGDFEAVTPEGLSVLDHIQVEGDVGFGKPDLDAFRHVLAALDVAPAAAWMVGDNLLWDIRGAQRAGIHAIWIDAHGSGRVDGEDVTPDRVISSLDDLLDGVDPRAGN